MNELDEVIQEFLVESYENLDQMDQDLVALEETPDALEIVASIFRTVHTIKGTCGFLGYDKLEKLTHVGENLLSHLRDGAIQLSSPIADALLATGDAVRTMLENIEANGDEGEEEYADLISTLSRLKDEGSRQAPSEAQAAEAPPESAAAPTNSMDEALDAAVAAVHAAQPVPSSSTSGRRSSAADGSIRVDVNLLDKLMNLVGELVLARNQILQFSAAQGDAALSSTTQRLNVLTTELQENVMKTRMQPIGGIWNKLPRVVRDLSHSVGKQVRLNMEGKDTELDRTLIEAIKDPLTHLVRNAVDHGIEDVAGRRAVDKPEEGILSLRAFHEGGMVNVEIADDGAGIHPEKLRAKAIEKALYEEGQLAQMSDRELISLIFHPGFSTAAEVTNVSGRGVGMDVVRTNIERIGGTVEIQSRLGEGTTIRVKIPLTLAIIPAQTVTTAGHRFAIPQVNLIELLRLEGEQARRGIELIHGTPVFRLRGSLLPLVFLDDQLGLSQPGDADDFDDESYSLNIIVLQADNRHFGLVVDSINDTEEIVVKPLGQEIKGLATYAGATIMGDGSVALILDVMGIAQRAQVIKDLGEQATNAAEDSDAGDTERSSLLLVGIGADGRYAMPLSLVSRLEEFPRETVESAGGQEVVQYRNQLLPLLPVARALGVSSADRDAKQPIQAVVHTANGRSVGLVVDEILDILHERVTVSRDASRSGLAGSIVVKDKVTDLVDVEAVIQNLDPGFFQQEALA